MNTMTTMNTIFSALDLTAQDICNSRNWTGLKLHELVAHKRLNADDVRDWVKLHTDEALDRAATRILDAYDRKKPYLDWYTEAKVLYDWADQICDEVLLLLGFPRTVHTNPNPTIPKMVFRNGVSVLNVSESIRNGQQLVSENGVLFSEVLTESGWELDFVYGPAYGTYDETGAPLYETF